MDISELWAGTLALLEPEISPIIIQNMDRTDSSGKNFGKHGSFEDRRKFYKKHGGDKIFVSYRKFRKAYNGLRI